VWHCHLLGHEENDMMRPIVFKVQTVLPQAPVLNGTVNLSPPPAITSTVVLTWTDATSTPLNLGNPANEIGFRIERATGANGAFSLIGTALANTTNFTDTTVQPNTQYRYRVSAYNVSGAARSNVITLTTPLSPVPAAPSNLQVVQNGMTAVLKFTDNSTNETSFMVQRMTGIGGWSDFGTVLSRTGQGATLVFTDTTVAIASTYSYRVQALNNTYASAWSNVATLAVLPYAPSNLRVTSTGVGRISLAWTNVQTTPVATNIELWYSANGNNNWTLLTTLSATTTFYVNTGLGTGTTRFYRVRDFINAGVTYNSPWSNVVNRTTP
jgi:hypothetical protein